MTSSSAGGAEDDLDLNPCWEDSSVFVAIAKKSLLDLTDIVLLLGSQSPVTPEELQRERAIHALSGGAGSWHIVSGEWEVTEDGFRLYLDLGSHPDNLLRGLPDQEIQTLSDSRAEMHLEIPATREQFITWADRNGFSLPASYEREVGSAHGKRGAPRKLTDDLTQSVKRAVEKMERLPLFKKLSAVDLAVHHTFTKEVFGKHVEIDPKLGARNYTRAYEVNLRDVADLIRSVRKSLSR